MSEAKECDGTCESIDPCGCWCTDCGKSMKGESAYWHRFENQEGVRNEFESVLCELCAGALMERLLMDEGGIEAAIRGWI